MTFYGGSSPVDADGAVTYVLKRSNGTTLASGTATKPPATTGTYQTVITPQSTLDTLLLSMTGTFSGQPVTLESTVEIVGGFYFSLAELRAFDTALTPQRFSDSRLADARTEVEAEFEQIMGQAWVLRHEHEEGLTVHNGQLHLKWPFPRTITALTVEGVDRMDLVTDQLVRRDSENDKRLLFTDEPYLSIVDITYEHGNTSVPYKVKMAAMRRARGLLLGQNARIDERATLMSVPDFGTFSLATPGMRGSWVGIPEVDVVLNNYMHGSRKGAY